VSSLFCTFICSLQFRHRTRFRDSFCLASVFKCLSTYLLISSDVGIHFRVLIGIPDHFVLVLQTMNVGIDGVQV